MTESIYKGSYTCIQCGRSHNHVAIGDSTVIKEFGRNYYLNNHGHCAYSESDRYCVLVKWADFKSNPNKYINAAFDKRSASIADEVVVRPK